MSIAWTPSEKPAARTIHVLLSAVTLCVMLVEVFERGEFEVALLLHEKFSVFLRLLLDLVDSDALQDFAERDLIEAGEVLLTLRRGLTGRLMGLPLPHTSHEVVILVGSVLQIDYLSIG